MRCGRVGGAPGCAVVCMETMKTDSFCQIQSREGGCRSAASSAHTDAAPFEIRSRGGYQMKRCRACGLNLPADAYGPRRAKCRDCRRSMDREYARTNAGREKHRARQNSRYSKARVLLAELKSSPCQDCGGSFPPYVMHFDHRDPGQKLLTVSALAGAGSISNMLVEIFKCDLVCANCHAIRTFHQRSAGSIRAGRPRLSV